MKARLALGCVAAVGLASAPGARAADADATDVTLSASDFTFTLSRVAASGGSTVLSADELHTYFSAARCACPTNVIAGLSLADAAAARLGAHTVDAQLMVGSDCDDSSASGCKAVGAALTLSSSKRASAQTLTTSSFFDAAGAACGASATSSTRLWAIVRLDGTRLTSEPSLAVTLGGAGPKPPTGVKVTPGDEGLLISWTPTGDATTLQGHQVLCSPGPTKPPAAHWDTCDAVAPAGEAGPFAALDPQLVCSDLVAAGKNSVRVRGVTNGRAYDIAVVAVGVDGTPSAPSSTASGTPAPTYGFMDLYDAHGGTAEGGCAAAGALPRGATGALALLLLILAARRRSRAALPVIAVAVAVAPAAARAQATGDSILSTPVDDPAPHASPRTWNLELRFAPYRPDVDREFADRGSAARPFQETFSSSRRLMTQVELDRQLLHRAGTWALGLSAGYYRVSAAALAADLTSRSGDETALRLIPLSAAVVYRADQLRERFGSPLVPYAKLGLDCTLWRATDTSQAATSGRTFGWHAAAGVSLDLSIFDPDAGRAMDRETGVNQTAVFFEVARYRLDGFGSDTALRVGDTTWFAGLMFEL
jgi:hypothetical protein